MTKNGDGKMKILHTADWHIGAKTDDLDRFEEQKEALNQVIDIAKKNQVDMVLIAGDIYDNLVPSAEDEELFYNTVAELSRDGDCAVVAIAGNHDDPRRLANANIFADKFGIYLVGHIDNIKIDKSKKNKNIVATKSGKGYIEFHTKAGEDIVLALLPYPSYYRYKETKREGDDFNSKVNEWLNYGTSHFRDDTINITMAHVMSYGVDMSEEDFLSYTTLSTTLAYVDQKTFQNKAHYTALGHIHSTLAVSKENNVYYSGSLLNYFFSAKNDEPTNVLLIDVDKEGVKSVTKEPLNVKPLKKFTVQSVVEAHKVLDENPEALVKVIIENVDNLDSPEESKEYSPYITLSDLKALRKNHPNLVTLSVITNEARATANVASKKDLTTAEIFDHFVKSKLGTEPEPDVKELFLSLMSEGLYETDND